MQIKQVDKMSTKNMDNYKQRTFRDIFGQLDTQEYKTTKKQIVRLQLKTKTKADLLKERPDNI